MQGMHGSGEIPRREVQAVVVKPWTLLAARPGVVEINNGSHAGNTRHEEANNPPAPIDGAQEVERPDEESVWCCPRLKRWIGEHGRQFAPCVSAGRWYSFATRV